MVGVLISIWSVVGGQWPVAGRWVCTTPYKRCPAEVGADNVFKRCDLCDLKQNRLPK